MIRKSVHKITLTVIVLLLITVSSQAQYSSEEEMKKAANEMFEKEDYIGSLKLFSQLLSNYPKDPTYNYKYGASALFAKSDKEESLRYLIFAASKPNVDPLAYYFLAKGYHLNYNFDAAIVYYNKFKAKGNARDIQKYAVNRQIEMCQNGKNLLKSMVEIGVLGKKEIKETDFFRSYELKGIEGKVTVKPDDFMSKLDKKKNENSLLYIGSTTEKKIIFSSYGKTENSGRDLFSVERISGGGWTEPKTLGLGVNTKYDENYPFLHPDGKTLYFCSKGYNSMGGYDVFKTIYNSETQKWSKPENLDFPINTPGDDVMYVSDADNKLAYFASSRASKQGKMIVYHVTVESKSKEKSVIKGFFLAESNPSLKSATITVRDVDKDRRYGVYKTHKVTGEYLLTFPRNGGKFKILVETTDDAPIHSAIIELPELDGFRALKQELRLVGEGDDEKLVVKNLFDESDEFDIGDPLVVQNILKKSANLDVNTTEAELNNTLANSLNNALTNEEAKSGYNELSDDQLINKTDATASKIIEQTETSKEQVNASYQIANEQSAKAKELYNEAKVLSDNGEEEQAKAKKLEAAKLINETVAALVIAKTLENEVTERESDLAKVKSLQEAINNDIDNGNRDGAENKLKELDEVASATYHNESALETEEEVNNKNLAEKEKTYKKTRDEVTELLNREYELTETINKLEAKKKETKKKSEREDIDLSIRALTIDVEDTKFDLANTKIKAEKAELAYNEAKNQSETTKSVIASVSGGNRTGTPISETAKLQLENDIAYFEKEGLVGLYPSDGALTASNNSNESYNLEEHKDEYGIIDDAGEIIDYNTNYSSQLADVDNENDPTKRAHVIVKINESWIRDIGEEIAIRKNQLRTETNNAKKTDLENKIASLEALKNEKQRELNENTSFIAANTTNNVEEEVNIMNTDGSIIDYESKYTEELEIFTGEDDFDSYTKKADIHSNWASATEQEILIKKMELAEADEGEKNNIENEIAVLENNLIEQQEFEALYDSQAESMRTTEPLANNEQPETNNEQPETNNEEPSTNETTNFVNNGNYEEKYTAELESLPEEDNYETSTKKAAIYSNWAIATEDEIAAKKVELNNASNEDKNGIENEIAVLENNLLEQQEFAALYDMQAESMRTTEPLANNEQPETNNEQPTTNNNQPTVNNELAEENLTVNNLNGPEDDFSNLKYNNNFNYKSSQSRNALAPVSELKNEARNLNDDAEIKLNTVNGSSSQNEKDQAIAEAKVLTDKSNRKQEEIARIYEGANRNEYYNNQAVISKLQEGNSDPYSNETIMTELFIEESDNYYEEAKQKREDAVNAPNFTAKEVALQKAYELEMKAIEKQKMAINQLTDGSAEELYANTENSNERTTNTEEPVVEEPITNNETPETNNEEPAINNEQPITNVQPPVATSNEITPEDQEVILSLQPEEITEIKNEEEYQNYAELKKENRRLTKEAEVEYIEAEKYQEEANDQKQLGVSLRAMAEGAATEEDKAKKLGQIKKLEQMIADNEAESTKLKTSATNKETQAKEAGDKSDFILINADENEAKSYTAIEKAETFDNEFLSEVMNRTTEPTTEEPLANNEQPETNNEEPVVEEPLTNNEQPETNNETPTTNNEEPLTNNEEPVVEEPIVNNEQPLTNNEEPAIEEPTTNTVPENIDEIPTVLNESIFVINNNQAAYSDDKRIPTSTKLPEGLIFKVQIGAFRNPIPQNHFKGFAPILAEDAGNGITRYTAGLFKTFNMANEAKKSIRSIGYSDAFVVAFLNGKRINIGQARAMLDGSTVDEGTFTINTPTNNTPTNEENTTAPTNNTEEVKDGVSIDVRNIDGVFYTVQVGVYSKPVTAGQLNNVSPLNSERMSSGLIKYTSGVYKTLAEANAAKDRIRGLGITDAFVVAYNGGTKISVAEATRLLSEGASSNPVEDNPVEDNPVEDNPVEDNPVEDNPVEDNPVEDNPVEDNPVEDNPVEKTFKNEIPGYEPKEDLNLEFKVKLGEYEEDVPVEDAGLFLRLTGRGVKSYEEGDKTVYTIGSFPDYESALDLQIEMKEMGVKKPEAIVFRNGVEMSLEEAFELMKENQ